MCTLASPSSRYCKHLGKAIENNDSTVVAGPSVSDIGRVVNNLPLTALPATIPISSSPQ